MKDTMMEKALENLHKEGYKETIVVKNKQNSFTFGLFSDYSDAVFAIRSDSYIDKKDKCSSSIGFPIWFYFDENSEEIDREAWD
jgi:hypothetical protein